MKGGKVSRATVAAADAVGAAVLAGVSAVSDSVGLGRIVAASAADTAPALRPCRRPRPSQAAIPGVRSLARAEPVERGRGECSAAHDRRPTTRQMNTPTWPTRPLGRRTSLELPAEAPIDSEVYATGADGVSPPVGVRPQLPRQLPPTVDPAQVSSRIELIIARGRLGGIGQTARQPTRRPGRDVPERGKSVGVPAGDEGRGCRPLSQDDSGVL